MRQTLRYNIIGHEKYKNIEITPIYDTSGYKIFIDGVVRYGEMIFTKSEIDEKIEYYKRSMKMEQFFDGTATKRTKTDEEVFIEKKAETVEDMREVMEEVLPLPIEKRKRGRPKKVVITTEELNVVKRGRGRPKGSRNKSKE